MNTNEAKLNSEEMRISDFGLVAALVTDGFGIRRTERVNRRVLFVFGKDKKIDDVINEYWAGNLKVYARQYFENTKMLKGIIYNGELQ